LDEQQQIFKIVFLKRYPANDCEGFVRSDDTTGQTGVSRTWVFPRRLYDADRAIRTIRAYFIKARGVLITS